MHKEGKFCMAVLLLSLVASLSVRLMANTCTSDTIPAPESIVATSGSADADSVWQSSQSVGLVLSGGGAKGIAHIGVIQALEDHNIPIDFVAGTSMGAIVGGLYAVGYTPEQMIELILSPGFTMWSTGQIDPNLTYYFLKKPQTPAFGQININLHHSDSASTSLLPASLISPLPMNFAFMDLFASYTAQCQGNFDNLFVPFRCVTSDVVHKHKIVCRSGALSDAIRASMTFPAVFAPIKMNGVDVYDGGIYDNFPVDVMREDFAPDIMIGVDVHSETPEPSTGILTQLENMIIQNNDYSLPADQGIRIHVDVSQFSLLDFAKARDIYNVGYRKALEMMDSIESRVTSRIPPQTRRLRRSVFKSGSPYMRFNKVDAHGGTPSQNEYLENIFKHAKTDTFGIKQARLAYYRVLSPGKIKNLMPTAIYNDTTGLFTLNLDAAFNDNFTVGAGGYISSAANSMLFASVDYSSMSFSSWNTRLMGWIGQSYMAGEFNWKLYLSNNLPSALEAQAVYSRQRFFESDKLFYQDNSPAFISRYEGFGRINYAWAIGRRAKALLGVGGGQLRNKFYSNETVNFALADHEQTTMNLGEVLARFEFNSLDNESYPMAGTSMKLAAFQTLGKYHHTFVDTQGNKKYNGKRTHWFQVEFSGQNYFSVSKKFSLGVMWDALVSNRKLLPSYYATLVNAPSFTPTAAMDNVFNKTFHAHSYLAGGLVPVWSPMQRAQVRLTATAFLPFRPIEEGGNGTARYGKWFSKTAFAGELDLVYNLPFAAICAYLNYLSYPAHNWSVGISFGLYFTAAQFLR